MRLWFRKRAPNVDPVTDWNPYFFGRAYEGVWLPPELQRAQRLVSLLEEVAPRDPRVRYERKLLEDEMTERGVGRSVSREARAALEQFAKYDETVT